MVYNWLLYLIILIIILAHIWSLELLCQAGLLSGLTSCSAGSLWPATSLVPYINLGVLIPVSADGFRDQDLCLNVLIAADV